MYDTKYHSVWVTKYHRKSPNLGIYNKDGSVMPNQRLSSLGIETKTGGLAPNHLKTMMFTPPNQRATSQAFSWTNKVDSKESIIWSPSVAQS
ncbi:hypothetical protein A8140_18855 [Vibrio campbellii CAIM 519 = NBRC 15631 = ATCC 25920]|nr:hypothetical protein A8140_18855 [Vibrio campbellii CAIM 519 = NBRC 15631 = ATCC 25920]